MQGELAGGNATPESLRLGLIVPTSNTVNESEWWKLSARGTSVHTARMHLSDYESGEEPVPAALQQSVGRLMPAAPDVLAFGCTASSMVLPPESLPTALTAFSGVPSTTTAAAIIAALKHLQIERVAVATPYHEALNNQWHSYLEATGFSVTVIRGLGIGAGGPAEFVRIAHLSLDKVFEHASATFAEAPGDALLLSCTDMPSLDVVEALEDHLGVPVVTSNTATLWHALSLSGKGQPLTGAGVLLREGLSTR